MFTLTQTQTYRCTRPDLYAEPTCPGHADKSARQGYYIVAHSAEEARAIMRSRFPGEQIDVQDWG